MKSFLKLYNEAKQYGEMVGGPEMDPANQNQQPVAQAVDPVADANKWSNMGRQTTQQNQQNQQKFQQRQYLFGMLQRLLPELKGGKWNTPEEASALYNQLGRSQGILQKLKTSSALDIILSQWLQLAMQGEIPNPNRNVSRKLGVSFGE